MFDFDHILSDFNKNKNVKNCYNNVVFDSLIQSKLLWNYPSPYGTFMELLTVCEQTSFLFPDMLHIKPLF